MTSEPLPQIVDRRTGRVADLRTLVEERVRRVADDASTAAALSEVSAEDAQFVLRVSGVREVAEDAAVSAG